MKYLKCLLFLFLVVTITATILFGFVHKTYAIADTVTTYGGLDLNAYCTHINQVSSNPANVTEWVCYPSGTLINLDLACEWQYNDPNVYAKQTVYLNPFTWKCFASSTPILPTPTPSPIPTPGPLDQRLKTLEDLVASQAARISAMKALHVVDNSGQDMGFYLGVTYPDGDKYGRWKIYLPTVNKIGNTAGDYFELKERWFKTFDCTGTSYMDFSDQHYPYDDVYSTVEGNFYALDHSFPDQSQENNVKSHLVWGPGIYECVVGDSANTSVNFAVTKITLPFKGPLHIPLQVKYQ